MIHARMTYCCLSVSVKIYNKICTRATCNTIALSQHTLHQVNFRIPRNVLTKRLYSEENKEVTNNNNEGLPKDQSYMKQFEVELEKYLECPSHRKKYKLLELEIDILRHDLKRVPDVITPKAWLQLLKMETKSQRTKLLNFLWINEKRAAALRKKKNERKKLALMPQPKMESADADGYGLQKNTLFMRIYDKSISRCYNRRLVDAIMFNPSIVFDCSYDKHMTEMEANNCAKQIVYAFAANRVHKVPFNIHICNFDLKDKCSQTVHRYIPTLYNDNFPLHVTNQSYLDMYDKKDLVYLTPHCRTSLTKYDPNKIYIIGAMVDKSINKPLSSAKAKQEGIKMARLPLELLNWGPGSGKNLTLNQVVSILLDINYTRDWRKALSHVPSRKLKNVQRERLKEEISSYNNAIIKNKRRNYVNEVHHINV